MCNVVFHWSEEGGGECFSSKLDEEPSRAETPLSLQEQCPLFTFQRTNLEREEERDNECKVRTGQHVLDSSR